MWYKYVKFNAILISPPFGKHVKEDRTKYNKQWKIHILKEQNYPLGKRILNDI